MRRALILLVAGLVFLIPNVAFANDEGHVSCGDTITSNTTLDSDPLNCSNNGIIIGADGINSETDEDDKAEINFFKVEEEVLDAIDEKGYASVIVALDGSNLDFSSLDSLRESVSELQDNVLSNLSESDFVLTHRYSVTNALAGKLNYEGLQKLSQDPLVEAIYAERILHTTLQESIPLINADDVWNIQGPNGYITGQGQTICVIDSGIDYTHPDLGGCFGGGCKVVGGWDFVNNDNNPMDDNSHGTHVAGIAAANGGIKGVAPDAKLLAVKVCDSSAWCQGSAMIAGTDWCINNIYNYNVSVLTMSIGDYGEYDENNCPTWMDSSIDMANFFNLSITISSGNEAHKNGIAYPACSPNAISVGATYDANLGQMSWTSCTDPTTDVDQVTCFTNSHPILDLMAPGALTNSTVLNRDYDNYGGTSMATPHVAGTIALMKQFRSDLIPSQILSILQSSGVPVTDSGNGLTFSRIDALAAVNSICTVPTNGMVITQDTTLCPGTYNLPSGIIIGANNIVLDGNGAILQGSYGAGTRGIYLSGKSGVTIRNINVRDYENGIYLYSSSSNNIANNIASNNQYGIYLYSSSSNTLTNNTANYYYYGIYLYSSSDNILTNNNASNNIYGILLSSSSNNNILTNNEANSNNYYGISLSISSNNTLTSNTASNNKNGILLGSSSNNILTNNIASNNNDGIHLSSSSNNTLSQNSMSNNTYNFFIGGSSISHFINFIDTTNTVNSRPVYYMLNSQDTIYDETTNAGFFACINCNNITVKNLNPSGNSHGILFVNTDESSIINNTLHSNYYGVALLFSSDSNALTNNIASNNYRGIYLSSSSDNTLNQNSMSNNTYNFFIEGSSIGHFINFIDTTNTINSKPIYYLLNNQNTVYDETTNAGFFACINCNNITVKNLNLFNNSHGILFVNTDESSIINNTLHSNRDGITLLFSSDFNTLTNNIANLNNYGIILDSSSNNILTNNTANSDYYSSNFYGIYLYGSSNNNISNNTANSFVAHAHGIYLDSSSDNTIEGNTAYGINYGIYLYSSSGNTLNNNIASDNDFGIRLDSSSNNILTNNEAYLSNYGIYLYSSSSGNTLNNNIASNNEYGIYLQDSSNNNVLNGNMASGSSYGNNYGIYLYGSSSNILTNNMVSNNGYGIYLSSSSSNTLTNNAADSNNRGIYLFALSNNNLIYNNYFNNTNNAFDNTGTNFWNINKTKGTNIVGGPLIGGNFWSDYNGSDLNGDGIGDTNLPYNSNGNIQNGGDYFPLVERELSSI